MTLRILDIFFLEGRPILFQIGLAVFKLLRDEILQTCDPAELTAIVKNIDVESSVLIEVRI